MIAGLIILPDALYYTESDENNNNKILRREIVKIHGVSLSKDKISLEKLNEAFKELKSREPAPFVLKLPNAIFQRVNIPVDMKIEDVKSSLSLTLSDYVPFESSEAAFDVVECRGSKGKFFAVAAVKKSALIEILELARLNGLIIKSVEPADLSGVDDLESHSQINLIPPEYIAKQNARHSLTLTGTAAIILACLFLFTSVSVLVLAYSSFRSLSSQNSLLKHINAGKKLSRDDLLKTNSDLQAKRKLIDETVNFMNDDIQVLEILNAIEANAAAGLNFSDVNFFNNNAGANAVIHAAASDDQICTVMANGLQDSNLFESVTLNKSENNKDGLTNFTMTLKIKNAPKK